jgi:hypothetical protein
MDAQRSGMAFRNARRSMRCLAPLTAGIFFVASACSNGADTRIALSSDTLVINGPQPVAIPAHVARGDGRTVSDARLTYRSNSPDVRLSSDGHVSCAHASDAVVAISQGTSEARLVVLCRPIRSFGISGGIGALWVGGPPVAIAMTAFDSAGKPVSPLRSAVHIRDDSIARLINGRVYALARGRTRIDMDFAGIETSVPVKVVERAVYDSVHLVGGEIESWRVSPGYYEVQLVRTSHDDDSPGLELGAFHASCARALVNRGQHYFCVLRDGASFVVRNSRPIGPRSMLDGELIAFRQP